MLRSRWFSALLFAALAAGCSSSPSPAGSGSSSGGATTSSGAGSTSGGSTGASNSGGSSGSSGSGAITFYPDVAPIVSKHCTTCHNESGIAPFSLLGYSDAYAHRLAIHDYVGARLMPPWPPGAGCSNYEGDRSLTDAEVATVTGWVDQGAQEGTPGAEPLEIPDAGPPLSRTDLTLSLPESYTPQLSPDDYHCFVVDWPASETTTKFVTGVTVRPGNAKIVHHVIAFLASPSDAAVYDAIDGGSTAGYTCFGGPGGGDRANWLAAWAPGAATGDFPAGTGIRVDPGSRVILQVHYNVLNGPGESDQTQVDLKLDDAVAKEAAVLPYADPSWLNGGMPIGAGESDAGAVLEADVTPYMGYVTNNVIPANVPFTIYELGAHMHLRGRREHVNVIRPGNVNTCLLDVPNWDFHWQGGYRLTEPVTVNPGDALRLECHWDNSAANQPDYPDGGQQPPHDLNWGEGTGDEMCLSVMYVTQ